MTRLIAADAFIIAAAAPALACEWNKSAGADSIPQPSALNAESFLLLELYSGATGPSGRFSEGFLL